MNPACDITLNNLLVMRSKVLVSGRNKKLYNLLLERDKSWVIFSGSADPSNPDACQF